MELITPDDPEFKRVMAEITPDTLDEVMVLVAEKIAEDRKLYTKDDLHEIIDLILDRKQDEYQ